MVIPVLERFHRGNNSAGAESGVFLKNPSQEINSELTASASRSRGNVFFARISDVASHFSIFVRQKQGQFVQLPAAI